MVKSFNGFDNLPDQINSNVTSLAQIASNVKSFGAKGDGITDDTTAIQNAINDSVSKNVKLLIPSGTYLISSPLIIPNGSHIVGDGWNTTIIKTNSAIVMLNATSTTSNYFVYLQGFQLDGTNHATTGIYFQQVQNDSQIRDVFVQNINGIGINYDGWCWTGSIRQTLVYSCTTGIRLGAGSNDITVDDCNIYNCTIGMEIMSGSSLNRILTTIGTRIINSVFQNISQTVFMFSVYNSDVATIDIKNNYIEEVGMLMKGQWLSGATWGDMKNINFEGNVVLLDTYGITPKNYFMDLSGINVMYLIISQNFFEDSGVGTLVKVNGTSYGVTVDDNLIGNASITYVSGGYGHYVRDRDTVKTAITFNNGATVGGLLSANGGQIKFPATQNASTDSNTLDDYKEASYTPTVTASSGTFTTVSASGNYTKVGRLVHFSFSITLTTIGTATGTVIVTPPFTPNGYSAGAGQETYVTGKMFVATAVPASNININFFDNTSVIANGAVLNGTVTYLTT